MGRMPEGNGRKNYRNEWKYLISDREAEHLRMRLSPFMQRDPHAPGGGYMIRSLYFDDYWHSSYEEKQMGVMERSKWRIRVYNCSKDRIALECKQKSGSYICKTAKLLSREELDRILLGEDRFLLESEDGLCRRFYLERRERMLRPVILVDYDREPLVQREGDVRITFDRNVRAVLSGFDLFDPALPALHVLEPGTLVLEVKFTEFLPDLIRTLLPLAGQEFLALSKYTLCYEKAHHLTDGLAGVTKTNRRSGGWD